MKQMMEGFFLDLKFSISRFFGVGKTWGQLDLGRHFGRYSKKNRRFVIVKSFNAFWKSFMARKFEVGFFGG